MDQSPAAAAQRLAFNKRALISAIKAGNTETVVKLLDRGVPIGTKNDKGMSLLHLAARGGHITTMRLLIERGCNLDSVDDRGFTPLHCAAAKGRTKAVGELIRRKASKSEVAATFGTPLHQAVLNGHLETAVAMLKEGCPLYAVNSARATVLHFAATGGNVDLVRKLTCRRCDVNAVEGNGCTLGTPRHQAAINGHVETAVAMLEEGRSIDVNTVDGRGLTPLHWAAAMGRTKAVQELIAIGASKSVVAGNCGTPLHQAALKGHVETAVAMLEERCPLDVVSGAGATVLHYAAVCRNVELIGKLFEKGCKVNAVNANGCTPLHFAAGFGRTAAVHKLIKLGAEKSVVAGGYGTPLHQAVFDGHVETVEALLDMCHDVSPSKAPVLDSDIIHTCDSGYQTPVMWALRCGQVKVFKLLISKGAGVSDKDQRLFCTFEHCFVGGHARKLSQFCEASGLGNSGDNLKGALTTLITQGLVDEHKVLCLCAVSGDSVFLDDTFSEIVARDPFHAYAMPAAQAVNCIRYCFQASQGASFIDELKIPDENFLNPLHMALLSLKCYEMGFAIMSVRRGTKDHTSFITKLLSHPVLKKTVHQNFPNGLSPLDLAKHFGLHRIATLIEKAGGRPGVWADRVLCELLQTSPLKSLIKMCDSSQGDPEAVKEFLAQSVQRSSWHQYAMIIGANVGAKTDEHEYKSLSHINTVDGLINLIVKCNIDINAMLNHSEGGRIHFGIGSNGRVEEGLDLEQKEEVITMLREKVGLMLRKAVRSKIKSFWPSVESSFVQVELVDLQKKEEKNDKKELTGWWRFDIVVKPHPTVVQLASNDTGYYRHGATSVRMTYGEFVRRIRAEPRPQGSPRAEPRPQGSPRAEPKGQKSPQEARRSVPAWDADKAATVGDDVGPERADHEYKSLMGPVGGEGQPPRGRPPENVQDEEKQERNLQDLVRRVGSEQCRITINAMLNSPTGGVIHYGIYDNGIVQEGLDLKKDPTDDLSRKVGDVATDFLPEVLSYVEVVAVKLRNVEHQLTGQWRFDIEVKAHPTVVLLSEDKPAYHRVKAQCKKMVHSELAQRVRQEPAGQFPHGY